MRTVSEPARSNLLEKLLATLDVRLHAFAVCQVQEGWRLVFDLMEAVVIHYVLAGRGLLQVGTGAPVPFAPHSIVIVPPRRHQSLSHVSNDLKPVRASDSSVLMADGLLKFSVGAGKGDILTVCGTISATYSGTFDLFEHLPGPMVEIEQLRAAFDLLFAELAKPGIGTRALTEALMKQGLILLLRQHLVRQVTESPLFAVLRDPKLARGRCDTGAPERAPCSRGFGRDYGHEPLVLRRAFRAGFRREPARLRAACAASPCRPIARHDGPADQGRCKQRRLRQPQPLHAGVQRRLWC